MCHWSAADTNKKVNVNKIGVGESAKKGRLSPLRSYDYEASATPIAGRIGKKRLEYCLTRIGLTSLGQPYLFVVE